MVEFDPNKLQIHGHGIDWQKAYKYAKLMEGGEIFPDILVQEAKPGTYKVKNGAHRTIAARLVGLSVYGLIVNPGDDRDED